MTAEPKELKPCPFCNGKDDLQTSEIPSRDGTIVWVSIHHGPSGECSIKVMADSEEKVIQLWNRRDYTFTIAGKAVGGILKTISTEIINYHPFRSLPATASSPESKPKQEVSDGFTNAV